MAFLTNLRKISQDIVKEIPRKFVESTFIARHFRRYMLDDILLVFLLVLVGSFENMGCQVSKRGLQNSIIQLNLAIREFFSHHTIVN